MSYHNKASISIYKQAHAWLLAGEVSNKESVLLTVSGRSTLAVSKLLHVIGREDALGAVKLPSPPIRVLLAQDVDDHAFLEGQFVLVLLDVLVDGDDLAYCGSIREGEEDMEEKGVMLKI